MPVTENTLTIRGLQIQFNAPHGVLTAVDGLNLSIPQGSIVGLVGESGCGKSVTALSVLGLLHAPGQVTAGEILFHGTDLLSLPPKALRQMRGDRISMIFQDPMASLNPVFPVGKQVAEVLRLHRRLSPGKAREQTIDLFRQVGIPDPAARYRAYPRELSGGLRQRVMIAMAMACQPELLIADEPTTALDVTIQAQILQLMGQLRREHNTSVLLITHNLGVVAQLCDYVYIMYAGRIVEAAETFTLFRTPRHPYTRRLLEAIPSIEGNSSALTAIPGTVPDLYAPPAGCVFRPRCSAARADCACHPPELLEESPLQWVRCLHPLGKEAP